MKRKLIYLTISLLSLASCRDQFLSVKSDKKMVIPETLDDMEAMLDYSDLMNRFLPWIEEVQADDYYISETHWNGLSSNPVYKNSYVWASDIYEGTLSSREWNLPYSIVFQANVVLEGLLKLNPDSESVRYKDIRARALFFRAWQHFRQAVVFAPAYASKQSNLDQKGIPVRLTSDLNVPTVRLNLEQTFELIVQDLEESERLFTNNTGGYKTRPSKAACQALLSRVFLYMQNYEEAAHYASSSIATFGSDLINFKNLDALISYPLTRFNDEVLFHSVVSTPTPLNSSRIQVDSGLYRKFDETDYRKSVWFTQTSGRIGFKGSYDGSSIFFNGISLAECYLTKAESLARLGRKDDAINTLTKLLENRVEGFKMNNALSDHELLEFVLEERRKELVFRGLRWADLKRLNLATETSVKLERILGEQQYVLEPGSNKYVFPIPFDVIELTGMEQNNR